MRRTCPPIGAHRRLSGSVVDVRTTSPTADVSALATWALERGVELEALTLSRPSLEDVYLDLVGEGEPQQDLDEPSALSRS